MDGLERVSRDMCVLQSWSCTVLASRACPCLVSMHSCNAYFVDLFVRVTNTLAIDMYKRFGYTVYRRVLGYYGGKEDAFDMRKALPRDEAGESTVPLAEPVRPDQLEKWTQ